MHKSAYTMNMTTRKVQKVLLMDIFPLQNSAKSDTRKYHLLYCLNQVRNVFSYSSMCCNHWYLTLYLPLLAKHRSLLGYICVQDFNIFVVQYSYSLHSETCFNCWRPDRIIIILPRHEHQANAAHPNIVNLKKKEQAIRTCT